MISQCFKDCLLYGIPDLSTSNIKKKTSNIKEATDKFIVEISKPQEYLQFYISSQDRPILNTDYLHRVYLDLVL